MTDRKCILCESTTFSIEDDPFTRTYCTNCGANYDWDIGNHLKESDGILTAVALENLIRLDEEKIADCEKRIEEEEENLNHDGPLEGDLAYVIENNRSLIRGYQDQIARCQKFPKELYKGIGYKEGTDDA